MILLDITLSTSGLTWGIIIAAFFILITVNTIIERQKNKNQKWALTEFEKFKQTETLNIQKAAEKNALDAAAIALERWKIQSEASIRQDAINRSYSVNLGKITEHLVPFHIDFPFNPKDARFIGSPIDLIVFDGHSENKDEILIYIVEVKTGNSRLTEIQRKIKAAVLKGAIRWAEINPDNTPSVEYGKNKIEGDSSNQLPLKL